MKPVEIASLLSSTRKWSTDSTLYATVDNAEKYSPWLYQHKPGPEFELLFSGTPLEAARFSGPMVFAVDPEQDLEWIARSVAADNKMSVMLYHTALSATSLLETLRHNLLVTFPGNKQAVLRYYDRFVASYFFSTTIENHQFAAINHIFWYGNTFKGQHDDTDRWWQCCLSGELAQIPQTATLTQQQSDCLQTLLREKLVDSACRQYSQPSFEKADNILSTLLETYHFEEQSCIEQVLGVVLEQGRLPAEQSLSYIRSAENEQQKVHRFIQTIEEA